MTPRDLITLALKQAGVVGVGQTPLAEDINDALTLASMMLAQWNRKRYLQPFLRETAVTLTGAGAYTIGPSEGAQFQTFGRIADIESAFWRYDASGGPVLDGTTGAFSPEFSVGFDSAAGNDPGETRAGVDFPVTVVRSREDFARITMKGISAPPQAVWLEAGFPLGRVYVWPSYGAGTLHLIVQDQLLAFADLSTDIDLPPEYQEALFCNLVARIRSAYGKPADPVVLALARASLNTLRVANAQIGTLTIDPALLPRGGWCGGGGGGVIMGGGVAPLTAENVAALLPTLPTTLPAAPGLPWNNGGLLSWS